ncbi:hypothetical protein GSI_12228 [Ganoderma sinense ZZ0214-1]|uniref:BTB domain-containing protein n=1 Tax=Ganoderma sinense ZZ0214-1 TaxID=1077348 RepID=A0A2G8RY80_9APHY|nr:hypothetical protein GSI_12228 [Ganoderma sinense ZZ0214-1]
MSDATDTRPTKRTRLSGDPPPDRGKDSSRSSSKPQFKPAAEFWFDDGNVILVASPRRVGFRIYRGLLASQSTIFSDMFASSSASPEETFQGCPVVQLSDSYHDLSHLLRVLLPKSRIHYQPTDADPVRTFGEVSALVRLAHKYHVQPVQDQAIAALRLFDFTDDFNTHFTGVINNTRSLMTKDEHAIGAVNLARLTDTPSMLPLALYHCAYLGGALLDGWKRRDGTVEQLSRADLQRCIEGRITLAEEQRILVYRLFDENASGDCDRPWVCHDMLRNMQENTMLSRDYKDCPALTDWTAAWDASALCEECKEELGRRNRRLQRQIWNRLPEIFDLEVEGWGEPESDDDDDDDDE